MADSYTTTSVNGEASFKRSKPPPPPFTIPAGHVAFRLICQACRIGGVIGKSGTIIKQLRQDTSARIRIEESPPGCDDRVIVIVASNSLNRKILFSGEEVVEVSAAQEAVVRVFERVLDVAAENGGGLVAAGGLVSCRLLSEASQVGSVIGKGGKVVDKIRKDSGSRIRFVKSEKMPACANLNDEMIVIEGDFLAVKKALVAVSWRLQDCPPVDKTRMSINRPHEAIPQGIVADVHVDLPPVRSAVQQPMPASSVSHASGRPLSFEADRVPVMSLRTPLVPQQEVAFRILCSNETVGGVIGKRGSIVRDLQNDSGASISVGSTIAECDERLITITAMENPESQSSPAQIAVVLVFNRCIEVGVEKGIDSGSKVSPVSARVVVPSNQVGCLLGKGGAIISEMRKVTGANIRIIDGNQVSKCASEYDQVVQITGEFVNVQEALYNVTGRLRENLFSSRMLNGGVTRSSSTVLTGTSPYARAWEPASTGLHSSVGVSHSNNKHTTLTQSMDNLGLSCNLDVTSSPRLLKQQKGARLNSRSALDVSKGLNYGKGGLELGSGNRSAIVSNTTVEILVPKNMIGSIYGEDGNNIARLRQISGAKVMVHKPQPGTSDRVVFISGSPDETQAAQSLLQAFILSGSS